MRQKTVTVSGTVHRGEPAVTPCGIITPETRTQSGLRGDSRYRLFFGDQTEDEVELTSEEPITVTGYIKEVTNWGNTYWDERAIFVTHIERG